jgi:hypothetical protein
MPQQNQGEVSGNHIFGKHVIKTTGNVYPQDGEESRLNEDEKTKKLFEMVDDYVEQA